MSKSTAQLKLDSFVRKNNCSFSDGPSKKVKMSSELNAESFKANFPLKWKKIESTGLNVDYTSLFSKSQADYILHHLENEVEYFKDDLLKVKVFGKWHQIPRKQVSFGDKGLSYTFSGNSIPALSWTPLISELRDAVCSATGIKFNFVLINRYKDGNDHIGEHRDDEKDLIRSAPIASLSFGAERDFIFKHKDCRRKGSTCNIKPVKLKLEHGSLLVMNPPTNDFWYHSLPVRKNILYPRVNLTFRSIQNW